MPISRGNRIDGASGAIASPAFTNLLFLTLTLPTYFRVFFTTFIKMPIAHLICSLKNYDFDKMKTNIKANLLDDLIIVKTSDKVVNFEI